MVDLPIPPFRPPTAIMAINCTIRELRPRGDAIGGWAAIGVYNSVGGGEE